MYNQHISKKVEDVFRKPKLGWSPKQLALMQKWVKKPLHNRNLDRKKVLKHNQRLNNKGTWVLKNFFTQSKKP
jgi:hypothetical protein